VDSYSNLSIMESGLKIAIERKMSVPMDARKSNVRVVIVGLLLGLFMAALDQTIVSTAMPKVIENLGGLDKFIWVYSAYMIAMVVSTPIFGKLSDMYGRKRFFLAGLLLFMAGSMLCGTAQNMDQLIVYRALQGIGGGSLMPIVFTIIFDIFPPEKRGKMTGLFGAVFGMSSVFGPILGASITDNISWRWIFYINVPIGIVSFLLVWRAYHESKNHSKQTIDWGGAAVLTAAILCLMFGLELGGTDGWAWSSWKIVSLFAGSAVLLIAFLLVERKAREPIVPLHLFKERLFTSSQLISLLYGAAMIAGASYIPLFIQGVFHESATQTSTVLTPMMLGVVASSMTGGFIVRKFAYRNIMLVSALVLTAGLALLGFAMDTSTSRGMITLYMIVVGLGMGVSFSVLNMSTLTNIPPQYKGSATSLVAFFRTIGSALGVTVFGAMQKHDFLSEAGALVGGNAKMLAQIRSGQALLDPKMQAALGIPANVLQKLLDALADSIIYVFQWAVVLPVVALVFAMLMGRARLAPVPRTGGNGGPNKESEPSFHAG